MLHQVLDHGRLEAFGSLLCSTSCSWTFSFWCQWLLDCWAGHVGQRPTNCRWGWGWPVSGFNVDVWSVYRRQWKFFVSLSHLKHWATFKTVFLWIFHCVRNSDFILRKRTKSLRSTSWEQLVVGLAEKKILSSPLWPGTHVSQFSTFAFSRIGCNRSVLAVRHQRCCCCWFFFFFNSATISNVIISILTL